MTKLYKDPSLPADIRAKNLLSHMTLEEKFVQMRLVIKLDKLLGTKEITEERFVEEFEKQYTADGIGSTYIEDFINPDTVDYLQKYIMEHSRLGIPVLIMGESLHGAKLSGCTVFPQAIGLGSAFDEDLVYKIAYIAGMETRAHGIAVTYAPNLDIARDPRWGRLEETYGEDPYLAGKLGVSYIRGLQSAGVGASPKHYTAHGSPEGGVNLAPVHAGERELREIMLPSFIAAVKEGGAISMMPAYSELDGVPVHSSRFLLTDILRTEIGFTGFTTSDFGAVEMLHTFHHTAENRLEAGKAALYAGIDIEAPDIFGFGTELYEAAKNGDIPMEWIDTAVYRVLLTKFRLGLFEYPYARIQDLKRIHDEPSISVALQAARESVVLLKNDDTLPLSKNINEIALIGPNAASPQLGDYTAPECLVNAVSLYHALKEKSGIDIHVNYARGCGLFAGSDEMTAEAIIAVHQSDVAIVVLGDTSHALGGIGWGDESSIIPATSGEGYDSHDLKLPACQINLLRAVYAAGKPVILIMVSGRPYDLSWENEHIPAIIQAWYPGEQGGHALAEIIFGKICPSGRLPVSFPKSTGQLPCYYNYKRSARGYYHEPGSAEKPGRDYVFADTQALFPFGYGLSYTIFVYSDLSVKQVQKPYDFEVGVNISNAGRYEADEVVLMYITDDFCRITPFIKQLKGFKRIHLKPGEKKNVIFRIEKDDLSFINEQMMPEVEAGIFTINIGELKAIIEVL